MAKDGGGSNSDVEEITADDFKLRESRGSNPGSRVWMNDLMRYSTSRNFNQDLYSFAWAQAVQNKPLGFDVVKKEDDDDEIEMFVVDDDENEGGNEKEEGELEEGEIGFGSETAEEKKVEVVDVTESEEIGEFDKRVGVILEELDSVTEEEAESSFEEVCSRLQKAFASLKQMFSEGHNPVLDALALQAFMGIQTVYSAFSSGNLKKVYQNKELLLRLLIHIKNQYSVLLTPEQVKEIDIRVHTLASEAVTVGKTGTVPEVPSEKPRLGPSGNNSVVSSNKLEIRTSFRNKVDFSPLLNLHADYDEDSLPSPTRDSAPPLPALKPIGIGVRASVPNLNTVESVNGTFHPYVTDAFKAVSSYQQKYGKNSIFVSNDLPSPTPSEDGNGGGGGGGGGGDDDVTHGEVSSSSVISNVRNVEPISTVAIPESAPINKTLGLTPALKSSAKSRDPRLRFMNTQDGPVANSRKHKATEEPANDDYTLKRLRNGPMSSRNVQVQLNENMVVGSRNNATGEVGIDRRLNANGNFNGLNGGSVHNNSNGLNGGSVPNTSTSTVPSVSLPALLKGIAVNPTMLMQLVQMEQQRLAAEGQQKVEAPIGNGLPVAPNNASIKPLEVGKQPAVKPDQMPPQSAPMNTQKDTGVIRMKPRDPRRILHTNMVQKSEGSGPEPAKSSTPLQSDMQKSNDRLTVREQGEQAQQATVSSQSTTPKPDIKNPKNHADSTSQPIPGKVISNSTEPKTQGAPTANPWGDLDHILDGYDEQQKAAIQKERARRIDEQSKMFSSRKLCLVLDLDHTLLNSAKFIEVDPAHEEILRKKEEQDRAKPQRHLFRFQHMGMWTKLRPGIWNFLEKASKLYELHLYTMGNKLYATEMAKVLDPTGALFAGRVISKGDDGDSMDGDERVPKNKDLDGVLGMESAVVIIDDSVRMWPHNKLNLIVVERYTYFPSSRRQFGLAGPSLLEIDHDERPEAGTLASSLGVIERIHQNFFSYQALNEVDVRNILASEQRKILAGCKIVFSRIFPVGEANPHLHPLWQAAEQFGAECTNQIDEHVTHVVANSLGTDKVNWALSTGRFVVHPSWVEASTLLYRRASEQDFAVKI